MNEYQEFIQSDDWKTIRKNLIEERGRTCERCFKECSPYETRIHHRHYDNELSHENEEDLMVLCLECHNILHQDLECF